MLNVKNKLLPILCLALCLCIVWGSATTAHAVDSEEDIVCDSVFEVGDTIYYRSAYKWTTSSNYCTYYTDFSLVATESNKNICFYLVSTDQNPSGYLINLANIFPSCTLRQEWKNGNVQEIVEGLCSDMSKPYMYADIVRSGYTYEEIWGLQTNIPIFQTKAEADAYINGTLEITSAVNYNKVVSNGSWVSPFEDIEINDNEVDLPKVSNLSHQGFTLTNNPTEKSYLVELYVENGLRNPVNLQDDNLGDAISNSISGYGHTYGMLDPVTDAYNYQTVFDLAVDYGVDNVGNLTQTCRNFYSAYPSANSYNPILQTNKQTWAVWGQPFGKNYVFWSSNTKLTDSDIASINCNSCPLAFTTYKIRYFYYDESNGWHYGPWSVYTYFSNGQIGYSSVYQDDEDKILETDTFYGEQDTSGNVTVNTSGFNSEQFIDLNNPNELFGYIRSVTNNVSATMGNFSTLFATVFTFIPTDVQYMIWFGVAVMVIIGVVKVIKG